MTAAPSAAWLAWALRAPSGVAELHAFEVDHPTWVAPLRLVKSREATTLKVDGVAYDFEAAELELTPPAAAAGELAAELELVVSSHAAELYALLAALPSVDRAAEPVVLRWWRYLETTPDAPEWGPLELTVTEAEGSLSQVTLRASTDYPDNLPSGLYYTSERFPWVADNGGDA